MARPSKYFSDKERMDAIRRTKARYMLSKEWKCDICGNKDYRLAGKWSHLNTKKHKKAASKLDKK